MSGMYVKYIYKLTHMHRHIQLSLKCKKCLCRKTRTCIHLIKHIESEGWTGVQ